jgi:hypothetical protein
MQRRPKCKDSLRKIQFSGTIIFSLLFSCIVPDPSHFRASPSTESHNTTATRRSNVLALFKAYAEKQMASGSAPKGIEQAFAASLEISPSLWSQIKSSRPIGDKLARQIEYHAKCGTHWLDTPHALPSEPSAAEQRFIELAKSAWQQSSAKEKRELTQTIKEWLKNPS